jgi:hypothetical protein
MAPAYRFKISIRLGIENVKENGVGEKIKMPVTINNPILFS